MRQPKFITSHRDRVRKLERAFLEGVSVIDREAYVEVLLLEDVARLYEYRLGQEKKAVKTGEDAKTKELNIEKFTAILNLFNSAIENAWRQIGFGNYSVVWRAIPERALMKAADRVKDLPVLKKIGVDLLRKLCDDPSSEEIEAVIKAVEVAIPDKNTSAHARPNIN